MSKTNHHPWIKWAVGTGVGTVAIAAIVVAALVAVPGDSSGEGDPLPLAENPTEDQAAADQAAARQEWEARQQQILEVLQARGPEAVLSSSPTKGAADAPVTLIKFSDFQCPYCALAAEQMHDFVGSHEDEMRYVYKHLPLTQIHPEALPSAKAAWAAGQQGQFWAYHDALFANQAQLGEALYVKIATDLGLDLDRFNRDRASDAAQAAIDADVDLARALDIRGTPTFLMNGLLIPGGAPPEFFEEALRRMQAASEASKQN
ncbi:protein-disulfide isomerase [filamentous cyanobacterium CCP5]|nr:protein-disulfide isomerase [filamentous cyanobacterium CCP5]